MELNEIRDRIGAIDSEIAALFAKRMHEVAKVAAYKIERGLPIEDRERELELIREKSLLIDDKDIRDLYVRFLQQTMDISRDYQRRLMSGLRIACAGDDGAGWDASGTGRFPGGEKVICRSFEEAYRSVEKGECDIAVLPLENSYRGEAGKVYDLIFSGDLYVNDVFVAENGESTTRYAVLSPVGDEPAQKGGTETLLMMFTVKDEPGGLAKAINIISAYGYNMRVMRSRPMKDLPWHYYFYAELEGNCSEEGQKRIIQAMGAACPLVKIKGCFTEDRDALAGGHTK